MSCSLVRGEYNRAWNEVMLCDEVKVCVVLWHVTVSCVALHVKSNKHRQVSFNLSPVYTAQTNPGSTWVKTNPG